MAVPAPSSAMVKGSGERKTWVEGAPGVRNSRRMSSAWVAKRARSVRVREY